MNNIKWESVIGLEIHTQLKTKSKLFSSASTTFGAKPNEQVSLVDLAMPGILPVFNKEVLYMAVKFGLAVNAKINKKSIFARKNYFYPDLPKGYQISQFELPIVVDGKISISSNETTKEIRINRAHLEEDAGKSIHNLYSNNSAIDLNRAGIPLLEIVSEPDMRTTDEALAYVKKIYNLVKYIDICDGNMQDGSFRCDANISIRKKGETELGTRTELKNINSFKFLEKAINLEIQRQIDVLQDGGKIIQETRLYDSIKNETRSMRSKEQANDYRYFPDPDLLPITFNDDLIADIRNNLIELPEDKKNRFMNELGLNDYDAEVLTIEKSIADYFEQMLAFGVDAKIAANWVMGDLSAALNKNQIDIEKSPVSAKHLAQLVIQIKTNVISSKIAKEVFKDMWQEGLSPEEIIKNKNLEQINDTSAIEKIVDDIICKNEKQVKQYKEGNTKILGFFVGQVMKATQGKANPQQVNKIINEKLS